MARGFNVASDVIKTTVDGYDLNKIWTDLTQVLQGFNASKTPLLNLLTVDTTASADAFPLDGGKMSFERASEFGTPKSGKADPKYFIAGYDLDWYDLALRFTSSFLRDATAEQIKSQHMAAQAASDDLNFSLAMAELLTPTVLGARATNPEDQTRYSLYSGQTDDTPPVYKGRTFTAAHTHYLTTQSADMDGNDLEVVIEHVAHHGYGVEAGEQLVVIVHPNQGKVIRGFRTTNGAPYDFIPAQGGVPYITSESIVGQLPTGSFNGLSVIGSFGKALIVETYDAFPGYVLGLAYSGISNSRNVLARRSHVRADFKGLRMLPGPSNYPLNESTYAVGVGFGVRNRGAAAVIQVTVSATYTAPTIVTV